MGTKGACLANVVTMGTCYGDCHLGLGQLRKVKSNWVPVSYILVHRCLLQSLQQVAMTSRKCTLVRTCLLVWVVALTAYRSEPCSILVYRLSWYTYSEAHMLQVEISQVYAAKRFRQGRLGAEPSLFENEVNGLQHATAFRLCRSLICTKCCTPAMGMRTWCSSKQVRARRTLASSRNTYPDAPLQVERPDTRGNG